jgi:hypothetical protein
MTLTHETLNLILSQIARCGTTVADVVIMAMSPTDARDGSLSVHAASASLHVEDLLEKLHGHKLMHEKVSAWMRSTMKTMYTAEILSLTQSDARLHYIAKGMTENKLREFNIDDIIEQMSANAPLVWELLDELLSADPYLRHKRDLARKRAQKTAAAKRQPHQGAGTSSDNSHNNVDTTNLDDSDDNFVDNQYWEFFDQSVSLAVEEDEDKLEDIVDQVERRHESKIAIVSRFPHCDQVQTAHDYV